MDIYHPLLKTWVYSRSVFLHLYEHAKRMPYPLIKHFLDVSLSGTCEHHVFVVANMSNRYCSSCRFPRTISSSLPMLPIPFDI